MIKRILPGVLAILAGTPSLISCHTVDDDRIPPVPVEISFVTSGIWEKYGVGGATDYEYFIKDSRQPAGFPYTALSQTGFGGVVIVGDYLGELQAYDMACPVELKRDIRIAVDRESNVAVCKKCGSTYDIFRYGAPLSGEASQKGYALTRYNVLKPGPAGEYVLVRR